MRVVDHVVPQSDLPNLLREFSAHRRLIDASLIAEYPGVGGPPYLQLWQQAAAEQQSAGRTEDEAEHAIELLVTQLRALPEMAAWFRLDKELQDRAIMESVAYWATTLNVDSRPAHELWKKCWEARVRVTHNLVADFADLSATVSAQQRLEQAWIDQWNKWATLMDRHKYRPETP